MLHSICDCTVAGGMSYIANDSQFGWNKLHSKCDCTQDSSTDGGHEAVTPLVPGGEGLAA